MKRKVIGIVGSPRKLGNTNSLVEAVLKGAQDSGFETKKVFLVDKKIKMCIACGFCKNEGKCIHFDDMVEILYAMKESDVWVIGTPVYWWGPTTLMKIFMDRWYQDEECLKELPNKKVVIVIPFGSMIESTADNTVGMFQNSFFYLKKEIIAIIPAAGLNNINDTEFKPEIIKKAVEIGKNLK